MAHDGGASGAVQREALRRILQGILPSVGEDELDGLVDGLEAGAGVSGGGLDGLAERLGGADRARIRRIIDLLESK